MNLGDLTLKDVRKALVALVTLAGLALTQGLVPDVATPYVVLAIGFANVYGVFAVRNGEKIVEPGHETGAL